MWRLAGLALLLVVLGGCRDGGSSDSVTESRPVEVATVAAGGTANVTLFVMNEVDRSDRIRIHVNGKRAVDAAFPASAGRAHVPIFNYRFAVPEGKTAVRVRTPHEDKVLRFEVTTGQRWVVIQNQYDHPERIPMGLAVYDQRPVFG